MRENLWIGERIRALGKKQKQLAAKLNAAESRVSEIIGGARQVKGQELVILAEFLEMNVVDVSRMLDPASRVELARELLQPTRLTDPEVNETPDPFFEDDAPRSIASPPQSTLASGLVQIGQIEYASIGRFDAAVSAGPGSLNDDHPEPIGYHLIEAKWLGALTKATPERLSIVRVEGDSMETTLSHGDWILLDRTQTRPSKEGVYALNVRGDTWVKRLSINIHKKMIRVISDNKRYRMQELKESELTIIGRVISIVARRLY